MAVFHLTGGLVKSSTGVFLHHQTNFASANKPLAIRGPPREGTSGFLPSRHDENATPIRSLTTVPTCIPSWTTRHRCAGIASYARAEQLLLVAHIDVFEHHRLIDGSAIMTPCARYSFHGRRGVPHSSARTGVGGDEPSSEIISSFSIGYFYRALRKIGRIPCTC